MKRSLLAATVAAIVLGGASAQAAVIDFETGLNGLQANGHPELTFGSFLGNNGGVIVGDFGVQGDGQSLLIGGDNDGDYLTGQFNDGTHTSLALDFGNDDQGFTNLGDLALLNLFLGNVQIASVSVVLNRDDIMNQTISYTGSAFDNFTFAYTNAQGSPFTGGGNVSTGLIEIVDNVTFDAGVSGAVPEPATWALMIGGFGLAGATLRRRRTITA